MEKASDRKPAGSLLDQTREEEALKAQLYQQIGQLKVELDWMKKKLDCSSDQKRQLIEPGSESISVRRQCELIGLPRASLYYEPQPESPENLSLMHLIDEQFTKIPFYEVLKMTAWLREVKKFEVNLRRVPYVPISIETLCPNRLV